MKYAIAFLSGLLLTGCASIDLGSEQDTTTSTINVASPLVANPNVLVLSTQLQNDYNGTPIQVLRVGNEVKVTYSSDALFGVGSDALLSGANIYLDPLIKAVSVYPGSTWRVDSFTDNSGFAEKNQQHSAARAEAMALYFINNGVASDHITYQGYGSNAPIADNDSAAGRAVNRRVVITISNIPVPQSVK